MTNHPLSLLKNNHNNRCKHVNFVTRTNVPGEEEFLFSQYSVFTIKETRWSKAAVVDEVNPHVITLIAAIDNKKEPEELPLAPWS